MRLKGQPEISLFSAIAGFFYLFFGRISYKFWGLAILSISTVAIVITSNQIAPVLSQSVYRLEALGIPALIQTIRSPAAAGLSDDEIFEAQGLVKTPKGVLPFTQKLRVFATSYDKNCPGCNETTASGLPAGYGVIAVDPKVIPLGTKLYIPGYGTAVAGDTGGAIKGSKIDLGFDDVKNGWWRSRYVDIYILN
jgi:3D (Asp-Asp-Asp) domain-containing protein